MKNIKVKYCTVCNCYQYFINKLAQNVFHRGKTSYKRGITMFNEEEYEESILEEFGKVVDDFQNINGFRKDSMIRLLQDKIKLLQD